MVMPWYPYAQATGALPMGDREYGADAGVRTEPGVLAALRADLSGELQAISQYEAHAAQAADPRIRDALLHIARDEREHVVELMRLIVTLDRQQAQEFARAPQLSTPVR